MQPKIAHDDLVLVADGAKALLLRNHGEPELLDLRAEEVMSSRPNPRTSEQGADKPGRHWDRISGQRSAAEQTDFHALAEEQFTKRVADALNERDRVGKVTGLVVVAPPIALAELRDAWSRSLQRKIKAEINKDLTKHPVKEIERILSQ